MSEIKDSGNRTEFGTGAVRDIQNDKGRCDLLPLDVVTGLLGNDKEVHILGSINRFMSTRSTGYLFEAVVWSYLDNGA